MNKVKYKKKINDKNVKFASFKENLKVMIIVFCILLLLSLLLYSIYDLILEFVELFLK
jgi:hypothetical protein